MTRIPTTTVPGFVWDVAAGGWREFPIPPAAPAQRLPPVLNLASLDPPKPERKPRKSLPLVNPRPEKFQRRPRTPADPIFGAVWDGSIKGWRIPPGDPPDKIGKRELPPAQPDSRVNLVYVFRGFDIIAGAFTHYAKIGSTNDIRKRRASLLTGSPWHLVCVAAVPAAGSALALERAWQNAFSELRVVGEWFLWTPALRDACRQTPLWSADLASPAHSLPDFAAAHGVNLAAIEAEPLASDEILSRIRIMPRGKRGTVP